MRWRGLLIVCCSALVACGHGSLGDDAGVPGNPDAYSWEGGTGRTIQTACEDLAAARCHDFEKCANLAEKRLYASEAACYVRAAADCVVRASMPGIVRPVAFVDRCTASIELADCDPEARLKGCDAIGATEGRLPEGAHCVLNAQCFDGYCPGVSSLLFVGYCARSVGCTRRVREGTPCTKPDCGEGLGCDATGHCSPRPTKIGDPCAPLSPCPSTLYCNDGACSQGSLPEGSACDPSKGCAAGLTCTSGECRRPPHLLLLQVGDLCGYDPAFEKICRGDAFCDRGICVPRPAAGEPCVGSCTWSSYCDLEKSTCTPIEACVP